MLDNLPERLNLAFPMFLGLAYLWATLSLPHLIRLMRQLVKGKGTP